MIFREKKKFVFASVGIVALVLTSLSSFVSAAEYDRTVFFGDLQREYHVTVPSYYDGTSVPLILDLHGYTGNPNEQADKSGFRELAEKEGIIVVHPRGWSKPGLFAPLFLSWNAFACCGDAWDEELDDVGLMEHIVEKVRQEFNIDSSRIYATGHSNGGNLAHRLACEASDLFAGIATISMPLLVKKEGEEQKAPCDPELPISVISYAGTWDYIIPYGGDKWLPHALDGIQRWADINGCDGPIVDSYTNPPTRCITHTSCNDNVKVAQCTVRFGGHELYDDWLINIDIAEHAWERLKDHRR